MADGSEDELVGALAALVGELRAHVAWAADTGVEAWPGEALAAQTPTAHGPQGPLATQDRAPQARMPQGPPPPPGPPPEWPRAGNFAPPAGPPGPPPRTPEARGPTSPRPPGPGGFPDAPSAQPRGPAQRRPTAPLRPDGHGPDSLALIAADIGQSCNRCPRAMAREPILHGTGRAGARLLILGLAPEAIDARASEPFTAVPGRLLTRMLRAIDLSRDDAFLTHLVKCHALPARPPTADEFAACSAFLTRQLRVVGPRAILALGAEAASLATGTRLDGAGLAALRRMDTRFDGVPLVATWHPGDLLRTPALKAEAWQDLRRLRALVA